jgi:hypothetical protein
MVRNGFVKQVVGKNLQLSDILEKRIDNVYTALDNAESDWAKNYWAIILVVLLRQLRPEKPTVH